MKGKSGKSSAKYAEHRVLMAAVSRQKSLGGRDIGEIPPIENVRRRASCRDDLKRFCEVYNPHTFSKPWGDSHLKAIARIEEAVKLGALFAFAMPRGDGKTSISRMAALWAISYGHSRYLYLIGATDAKGKDSLDSIRTIIRFSPIYAADFPEISYPAICLDGIANRAGGQVCKGESTLIEWSVDGITLPTVPPPKNWPKTWAKRQDGKVPTAGSVIAVSGLTGEGLRGSLKTLTTGEMMRPDFFLLDDPQTAQSADSDTQNITRLNLVAADLLNMAGPGKSISGVMPCTVIKKGDMVDQLLNRKLHPLWRGERTKMLTTMPKNLDKWEDYFAVYKHCAQLEPPDYKQANEYYIANREVLDEGGVANWEDRKKPDEVSAIQHAMNLYCRDKYAFFSEYQNDPIEDDLHGGLPRLIDVTVAARTSGVERYVVPNECTRLTAFIDLGAKILWYVVIAWDESFGGSVIDYGTYPKQPHLDSEFTAQKANPSLESLYPSHDVDGRVHEGLVQLCDSVFGREYDREDGSGALKIEKALIDSGWKPDTVHIFLRQSALRGIAMPSLGDSITAAKNPISAWPLGRGERPGWNWRITPQTKTGRGLHCKIDTNAWKSFAVERLLTPMGSRGALTLFGKKDTDHRLFSSHMVSEFRVRTEGRGRKVDEWSVKPGVDNHWWDCVVGACVAASVSGLNFRAPSIPGQTTIVKPAPVRLSQMQADRRAMSVSSGSGSKLKLSDLQRERRAMRV